jgi:hypothetical protein
LLDQAGRFLVGLLGEVGDDDANARVRDASAAARPMPLAAPVTNATLPAKLPSLFIATTSCSLASSLAGAAAR